jgi:hypothetical protein
MGSHPDRTGTAPQQPSLMWTGYSHTRHAQELLDVLDTV